MKTRLVTVFVSALLDLAVLAQARPSSSVVSDEAEIAQFVVELRDGSKLIGTPAMDSLPLRASFGKIDLAVKLIEQIEFNEDRETAIIHSTGGDQFQGVIDVESLTLKTAFGTLKVPLAAMARIFTRVQTNQAGLILYYSFDKDEGAIVTDQGGSNHTGKVCGATHSTSGVRGGSANFNGMSSFIHVGDLGRVEEGTICFWMRPEEIVNWRTVLSSDFARGGYCVRFDESTGGAFTAGELNRYCHAEFTRALVAGNWYHVAFVWNGTEAWGYLDGRPRFAVTHTRPGVPGLNLNLGDVVIGKGYSNEACRSWKGLVDEFRVFNRMLGPDEIAQLYKREGSRILADKERIDHRQQRAEQEEFQNARKRPARGLDAGLALYYSFDDDDENSVSDQSSHRRDGRIVGARLVRGGVRGGACSFDGTSHITAGDIFNLDRDTPHLTVCFWVKAPPITGVSNWAAIIGKSQEQSPWAGWGISANPSSRVTPGVSGGYPQTLDASSKAAVCDGQWHFIAAIYEVTEVSMRILCYLDGEPSDFSEWIGPHGSPVNSSPLTIGQRVPGGSGGFQGTLDELRIYTRSLAATEIAELYGIGSRRR